MQYYYRIMSEQYCRDPYSSSSNAGRWNPKGSRMIYAGSSPAVSLLEYLCIKGHAVARNDWYMIMYIIADESFIGEVDPDDLPSDWNALPHARSTQEFGHTWLKENEFPFLKVPSARIDLAFYPAEHNLLINPAFPAIADVLQVVKTVPFNYLLGW